MINYLTVSCLFVVLISHQVIGNDDSLSSDILKYYDNDLMTQFTKIWEILQKSYENLIRTSLEQTFGRKDMNIFVQSTDLRDNDTPGFYVKDNVIELLLVNLTLRELPRCLWPEVTFELDSNALRIEAALHEMFVDADYVLFRNKSEIVFGSPRDMSSVSPFTYSQVKSSGRLALIMEECSLIGTSVLTLLGRSVNLGHESFRLFGCKFNVEIQSDGEPVIAPYLSQQQMHLMERVISRIIAVQFKLRLQGILHSHMNTTSMCGSQLGEFIHAQRKIFKHTTRFLAKVIKRFNYLTVQKNNGLLKFPDFHTKWDEDSANGEFKSIAITNLILHGVDSAYTMYDGGPYSILGRKRIGETVRFNNLQLKGQVYFENATVKANHSFAGELKDFTVSVKLNIDNEGGKNSKSVKSFQLIGWRISEFGITSIDLDLEKRFKAHALVTGYLINEVPPKLTAHLNDVYAKAMKDVEDGKDEEDDVKPRDNKLQDEPSNENKTALCSYEDSEAKSAEKSN